MKNNNSKTIKRLSFKKDQSSVLQELKSLATNYFESNNLTPKGNIYLIFKALFFILLFISSYTAIVFADLNWVGYMCCYIIMGITAAGVSFNMMHDGAHGSFSESQLVNTIAAYSINFFGGDAVLWKNKHNMIHHTYTNIEGYDQDIAQMPVFRLNEFQKRRALHKIQHIYALFVYGLSSLLWVFVLDYQKYFSGKVGTIKITPSFSLVDHVVFWITKIGYLLMYIVIPIVQIGFVKAIVGFLLFHFTLGMILSVIFQLAHVVEETSFNEVDDSGKVDDIWAVHQLKTTSNFATNNIFLIWFTGGLNFQVEHHLFPNVSHIHYPALNKIVKQYAKDNKLPYYEFDGFWGALKSHLNHLKYLGKL